MGAVWVRTWSGLRARATAVLLLIVVLGLAFAFTLAAVAGSERGRDALDRFVAYSRVGSIEAYVNPMLPVDEQASMLDTLVAAVGAAPHSAVAITIVALPGADGVRAAGTDVLVANVLIEGDQLGEVYVPIVVAGELPLAPGAAAVNEALAGRRGLAVGDTFEVALFPASDLERLGNGEVTEPSAIAEAVVGAIVRHPNDLARSPSAQPGTLFEADDSRMFLHPSFWAEHGPDLAGYGRGIIANPFPADAPAVADAMRTAAGEDALVLEGEREELARITPVQRVIDLESNTLLAFAGALAVVAIGLVGTAARRVLAEDDEERLILTSLGFARWQIIAVQALRAAVVALVAGLLAVVIAAVASSRFPIGVAGAAEVERGIQLDLAVLGGGAVLLALVLVARVVLGVVGSGRPEVVTSSGPSALAALPGIPAAGCRMALAGLRGSSGSTVRTGMAVAVAGVVAVVAATTFGVSLARLVDTPALQGWAWDAVVGNFSQVESSDAGRAMLEANPDVAGFAGYTSVRVELDGEPTWLLAIDPGGEEQVAPVVLDGRAPTADDEVALGSGTLAALDKVIGEEVEVDADGFVTTLEVVGEVVAPAVLVPEMDLDTGGTLTIDGATELSGRDSTFSVVGSYAVRLGVAGADRPAALERLRADFPGTFLGPMAATDVRNLDRVRGFPYVLAGLLGLLVLGSVAVVLATLSRRRRRDLAIIRVLGADGSQVRSLLGAQATALTFLALVVGLPLGVALGRVLWRLAANGVGSAVGPTVPGVGITAAAAGVLLAVNVAAQVPATTVVRARPGPHLRTE